MPLIIISGIPSSGKSTRTSEIQQYFKENHPTKRVIVITENLAIPRAGFQKNDYYSNSQYEKMVRADLKSDTIRQLNKEDLIILDAGNYIKGYRYEIYCASKAARTPQCTIFCGIPKEDAWQLNEKRSVQIDDVESSLMVVEGTTGEEASTGVAEASTAATEENDGVKNNSNVKYTREIFDALCLRYEEPHGNSRWDSPLFTVFPGDRLDFEGIYSAIYESKPPPPNTSTQNAPLSATNYLFELDSLTQEIVGTIVTARKIGNLGPVTVGQNQIVKVPAEMNASQLNRLRRQFLNYNKLHTGGGNNLDKIPNLFVQFLNSNFNK